MIVITLALWLLDALFFLTLGVIVIAVITAPIRWVMQAWWAAHATRAPRREASWWDNL
jgi:hypothetical protein